METTAIGTFLENMTAIVTEAIEWMGLFWNEISTDPILLTVVIGLPLVGLGVGLLTRLIRV